MSTRGKGHPTLKGMRHRALCFLVLTMACSSEPDGPGGPGTGGGAGRGGDGSAQAGSPMSGGTSAGMSSGSTGGERGGEPGTGGGGGAKGGETSTAGTGGMSRGGEGGAGGAPRGGNGGTSASAGRGGGGGAGPTGGAGPSGGSGGGGACVKNLACKLDPPPTTGDIHQDCVNRINQFLTQCACLPALTRRTDGEACADQMAEYDAAKNKPHAGFTDKICQPAGSQNSCPGYSSNTQVIGLCLQQMWDEGPPPTEPCTGDCYQMYGHFINMTDENVTKVSCGFYTTSAGKVWAVQNFSR